MPNASGETEHPLKILVLLLAAFVAALPLFAFFAAANSGEAADGTGAGLVAGFSTIATWYLSPAVAMLVAIASAVCRVRELWYYLWLIPIAAVPALITYIAWQFDHLWFCC